MKYKKYNAVIGLFLIVLLIVHLGYEVWSYKAFYYNPLVTKVLGYGFAVCVGIHALLSIYALAHHESRQLRTYARYNVRTIVQRLSVAGLLILFPLHIKSGDWIAGHKVSPAGFTALMVLQVLFWLMIYLHVTTSFTRALITLGLLEERAVQRKIDTLAAVLLAALLIYAGKVIIQTQMFLYAQGG